ncbi:MAG: aldose 1-epimerase family protein [Clostridia bacterium]|nr:aldose 1-epimerase family protein [Clostridia bacterium]
MVILKNDKLTVSIEEFRAEIKSVKTGDGTEYMWQGGGEYWEGTAPNLFPIVGRLCDGYYTIDGVKYELGMHGLSYGGNFKVIEATQDRAVFELTDSEESLKSYPFKFSFKVRYTLTDSLITVDYIVENRDDKTMYYSLGAHPGFNVPLAKGGNFAQYYFEFEEEAKPIGYELTADGLITGKKEPFSLICDTILPLTGQEIFVPTVFLEDMSTKVTLKSNKTRRSVTMTYEGFKYLALWHDDNSPFICIEPWTGTPELIGNSRELKDKNGITALDKGKTDEYTYTIEIK